MQVLLIAFNVLPYVYIALFDSVLAGQTVVDDSSLTITIHTAVGLNEIPQADPFVTCGPNPFSNTTVVSINSQRNENAQLCVYNLLGKLVYEEKLMLSPGRNSFDFNGLNLRTGAYLYSVSTALGVFTDRLIKLTE